VSLPSRAVQTGSYAFSLMELLVVIAILAILTAILLPVYSSVRESMNAAGCASSMRQLGVASQMYLAEHNNNMYPHNSYEAGIGMWTKYLNPYLNNITITNGMKARDYCLYCPSVEDEQSDYPNRTGYGKNGHLGMLPGSRYVKRITDAYDNSKVVLIWEDSHAKGNADGGWPTSSGNGGSWYSLSFRHNGRCHVLLLDGHVESLEEGSNGNGTDYPNLLWGPFPLYPSIAFSSD
jgi:prepilin-type processing-associated H-X9-DG protein/prepilin-type N-terminal cleavage/methylation domain-containing protein